MTLIPAALGAMMGAIIGSFLATLCLRWERGEQASRGRSACDNCKQSLAPVELIPILSYAVQRGRCRTCAARIPPEHVQIEFSAAAIGAGALALSPDPAGAALAALGWLLLPLTILDARNFWLPDRLTLLLAAAGLVLGGTISGIDIEHRLIGGIIGFLTLEALRRVYRQLRSRDGLGAGDPKLLGAIGLWLGWQVLPLVLLTASVAGVAVALVQGAGRWSRFPFGAALAVAAWIIAAVQVTGKI